MNTVRLTLAILACFSMTTAANAAPLYEGKTLPVYCAELLDVQVSSLTDSQLSECQANFESRFEGLDGLEVGLEDVPRDDASRPDDVQGVGDPELGEDLEQPQQRTALEETLDSLGIEDMDETEEEETSPRRRARAREAEEEQPEGPAGDFALDYDEGLDQLGDDLDPLLDDMGTDDPDSDNGNLTSLDADLMALSEEEEEDDDRRRNRRRRNRRDRDQDNNSPELGLDDELDLDLLDGPGGPGGPGGLPGR